MNFVLSHKKLFFLLGGILVLLFIYFESFVKAEKDFDVFIGAAKLIREGKTCYNSWIPSGKDAMCYCYSPLFAIVLIPLSYLSQYGYNIVWISLNIFFLYRIILLINFFSGRSSLTSKWKPYFYLIITICTLRFLLYNFDLGQMTIFLVYASMESSRLIAENKKWQGASLLAFAINIKLLPLTLLFYFVYRGEFKASIFIIFFSLIYLFLPALFLGFSFNNRLLQDWWSVMTTMANNSMFEDVGRESLSALVPAYVMDVKEEINFHRNVLSLSVENTFYILNLCRIIFVLLSIYFFRAFPFKKITNPFFHYYALSYILLITPLIAPHQGKYAFFYSLPAFSYLTYFVLSYFTTSAIHGKELKDKMKIVIAGIIVSFIFTTLTSDGIIGRNLSNIANYYHLITIGIIILILPLALLTPEKLVK